MPIGIQRLNDPHPQPSSQIAFIKPLPGPDEDRSKDLLERVAAICHPILKANHLSVTSLEEHEPNPEFVGRNFNAGEVVQLVLRSQRTGQWLSFRTVQMVMVHELAHIVQMNHSRAFWKVRNQYAGELRGLWFRRYTGDGLWGRGQILSDGNIDGGRRTEEDVLPERLCGGAYRSSRRRKRKRAPGAGQKEGESYADRRQRAIAKKFGVQGQMLGGDHDIRVKLEKGQEVRGKPRVANSSRGRELRVAAALARFGQQKEEEKEKEKDEDIKAHDEFEEWLNGSDDSFEDIGSGDETQESGVTMIHDRDGRNMIDVCSGEDRDDVYVKKEMDELRELEAPQIVSQQQSGQQAEATDEDADQDGNDRSAQGRDSEGMPLGRASSTVSIRTSEQETTSINCPICSLSNSPGSVLCIACSHVMDIRRNPNYWQCLSVSCKDTGYLNSADCGLCGVCGSRKPVQDPG